MARRQAPLQINKFDGGLRTEFNPLRVPPNVTTDERNMEITTDGSRAKRLGFDYEPNYSIEDTGIPYEESQFLGSNSFRWDNAGGNPDKSLLVIQLANRISIHDLDSDVSISSSLIFSETLDSEVYEQTISFAVIDGILVAATGRKLLNIYEYDEDTGNVTKTQDRLLIRDLFGVQAFGSGEDLTVQENLKLRPVGLTDGHLYNLRNQGFNNTWFRNGNENIEDPIFSFRADHPDNLYPSNADNINRYIYPNPQDDDDAIIERFYSEHMTKNAPGVTEAPKGSFIIDALERGQSRRTVEQTLRERNDDLTFAVNSLPTDRTPGGAKVIEEFGGRIWFGGFSAKVIGGDSKSPRMSSYVLFSLLVQDRTDITKCYQKADPTSLEDSALVDTDGGFIRLDGAFNIQAMKVISNSLFIFAQNGVWRISGGEGGFSATNYSVEKITDYGTTSVKSVVIANKRMYYWGAEGINVLAQNEFGIWEAQSITQQTIQSFYLDITDTEKQSASGIFDLYEGKIRWVYTRFDEEDPHSSELILDLNYQAFTVNRVETRSGTVPLILSPIETRPYRLDTITEVVTDGSVAITDGGENVVTSVNTRQGSTKQTIYLVLTDISEGLSYTVGFYYKSTYTDWDSIGSTDYDSYLIAGSVTGGEARFKKQVPYLNVFFKRTEDGFDEELNATNSSSCLLSSQWNWTVAPVANKWSTPRQAYRLSKLYFPTSIDDPYETGETIISTRNKIRGIGHSVAFRFQGEPGKNLHIHGWAFDLIANTEE